jgi:ppGpp synthetase/RelA/SpoT-type nucleotidyltranferase
MPDEHQDTVWKENPEYIRGYLALLPIHERLCDEVKHILTTDLKKAKIEYAHIQNRAKTLSSFCEKICRKSYKTPFSEITDFAGVRIVYLYLSDRDKIEAIIEKEFDIMEKVNKVNDADVEKFGYGALHYVAKIKKKHSGARYDDLKSLACEIQVRTILQDAWAIVAHHLSYKQESDIPKELRRKLNALSGLFETADDQFEHIRFARTQYQDKVKGEISKQKGISLAHEINLDNLTAYLKWKFPDREDSDTDSVADLLSELQTYGYSRLVDMDEVVDKTRAAVLEEEKDDPPTDMETREETKYIGVGLVRSALSFVNNKYYKDRYKKSNNDLLNKYKHLIK